MYDNFFQIKNFLKGKMGVIVRHWRITIHLQDKTKTNLGTIEFRHEQSAALSEAGDT